MSHKTHACSPASQLPRAEAQRSHTTCERGNDFQGWAIYTDGCARLVNGETFAEWGAMARSLHARIDITFGPVITTRAHLAFSGARTPSNNTAEMTAMIQASSFLGPRGTVARDASSCIYNDSNQVSISCVSIVLVRLTSHQQLVMS